MHTWITFVKDVGIVAEVQEDLVKNSIYVKDATE